MSENMSATYEELAELEKQFEDAETEIIRQQCALTKPLYEKREKLIAKIPHFWQLVIEQAPPDIDQFIQPTDSFVLLDALTSFSISHFEIENGGTGDPRSIAFRMEFSENDHFEDKVLEKKFWFRRSRDGRAGLVSEPVPIKWKAGKDLTHGLLDLAVKVWEQEQKEAKTGDGSKGKKATTTKPEDYTADQKALQKRIDVYSVRGVSFFCWFGYRGESISAEESTVAIEDERKRRAGKAEGKSPESEEAEEDDEVEVEVEDDEENPLALEIFPDGDDLAVALSEDLWPSALQYFTQAQEKGYASEEDFGEEESGEEGIEDLDDDVDDGDDDDDDDDEAPPLKRVKA